MVFYQLALEIVFQKYNYFLFTTVKSLNSTNNFTKIIEWLKL